MNLLSAAVLTIALAMAAGSAGAQSVLGQLGGGPRGGPVPQQTKPEVVCNRFDTALEMHNAGDWSALDIVRDETQGSVEAAEAALQRLGGSRLVLQVDAAQLRKDLIEQGREDVRRVVRNARLGSPGGVFIRGEAIEFRLRDGVDPAKAAEAFAALTSGPLPPLASQNIAHQLAGNGVVTFVVPDHAVEERKVRGLQNAIYHLERRLRFYLPEPPLVRSLDDGRIVVIAPGLRNPEDFHHIQRSWAKLALRQADRFADPCDPAGTAPDFEVLKSSGGKASLVVEKRVRVSGEDIAAVAVVRKPGAQEHSVVLRFLRNGHHRLAQFAENNVGQSLAFILDNEVIAAPVISEPITSAAVQLSGGLSLEQARQLALLLRAAVLPAHLILIEQQVVDPRPQ
jgi:preprotein translocase subunit SecD